MKIIRCSLSRWWIALAAIPVLALTTTDASSCETTGSLGTHDADRAASASSEAVSDLQQVDKNGGVPHVDRLASSSAARLADKSTGDRCPCHSPRAIGPLSKIAYQTNSNKSRSGPTGKPVRFVSRPRMHVFRVHGGSNLCWGDRFAATLAKQQLDGTDDDDKASDNPNDDDDAYQDLNVYYDSDAPSLACLPVPVSKMAAPEFAPKTWDAPLPTLSATLQRLRC